MLFMALNGAAATQAKDVDTRPPALAQVLEQARKDFEVKYNELGLLGAAPLVGMEASASNTTEIASVRADFDGAAQAQPQAAAGGARTGASH
jgi:hypothetical protein